MTSYRTKSERIYTNLCDCGCYELLQKLYAIQLSIADIEKNFWQQWHDNHPKCDIEGHVPHYESNRCIYCCDIEETCPYCAHKPEIVPSDLFGDLYEQYYKLAHSTVVPHLTHHLLLQYDNNQEKKRLSDLKMGIVQLDPAQDISEGDMEPDPKKHGSMPVKDLYDEYKKAMEYAGRG